MSARRFTVLGLESALREAETEFRALGSGLSQTWYLPAGRFEMSDGLDLGAELRNLSLIGDPVAGTTLSFPAGHALSVTGERVDIENLRVEVSDAAGPALSALASLALRMTNCRVSGNSPVAMQVRAPGVNCREIGINGVSTEGALVGIDLTGSKKVTCEDIAIAGLTGDGVTGLLAEGVGEVHLHDARISGLSGVAGAIGARVRGNRLTVERTAIGPLTAETGPALGLDLTAAIEATISQIGIEGLRGAGVDGTAFEDTSGDGAGGLRLSAPDGHVTGVSTRALAATSGRAVALRLPDGIEVGGLLVARALPSDDLQAALQAAQAHLADEPASATAEWLLPAGTFRFDAGLSFGAPDRSLRLRGAAGTEGGSILMFEADGGGAIAGDVTGLSLAGSSIAVEDLTLRLSATGAATALAIDASEQALAADVGINELSGASFTGIACTSGGIASVHDCIFDDMTATAGAGTALALGAVELSVSGVEISAMDCAGEVTGLAADASGITHVSTVSVQDITGEAATGVVIRLAAPDAASLSVLDVRVSGIRSTGGADALATGAALIARGDLEIRALGVSGVEGPRALGALVSATGTLDWLAGEIFDIRSTAGGAAGVRAALGGARAERVDEASLALRDIHCEAVRGDAATGVAVPPDSWLAAAPDFANTLVDTGLAALPAPGTANHAEEILGIGLFAPLSDFDTDLDAGDPGSVALEDCMIRRISGTALQADCVLRDMRLRGVEAWTAVDGGWVDCERLTLANVTWHRMRRGLNCAASDVAAFNALFTQIDEGRGLFVGESGDLAAHAVFAADATAPLSPEPDIPPYVDPGPATPVPPSVLSGEGLAPDLPVDLALTDDSGLHERAVTVEGSAPEDPRWVGAVPPIAAARCVLVDPAPPPLAEIAPATEPSPFVSYLNRDSRGMLDVMMARAEVVIPEWTTRNPADFTTMLFEALASEIDFVAYRQEEAQANAYLSTATIRRALEDHARLVDHRPDPGQSATAMLSFGLRKNGAERLEIEARLASGETLRIPRDTLVVNPDLADISVVFATEEDLEFDPALEDLKLAENSVIEAGALSAEIAGDFADRLEGRWLALTGTTEDGAPLPPHVVWIVSATESTNGTFVTWDPRRPAPAEYLPDFTALDANVVPAHHGVPLSPLAPGASAEQTEDAPLAPWQTLMTMDVPKPTGRLAEVALPLSPISNVSTGWPFPGASPRSGTPQITAFLDEIPLRHVDDLSFDRLSDPRFALRPSRDGGAGLAISGAGDGGILTLQMRIGLGAVGNVGSGALTQILLFGDGPGLDDILPGRTDRLELLKSEITVTNHQPAIGGRDPTTDPVLRAEAPLMNRGALNAVAARDYADRLTALDEVAAAQATVADGGLQQIIRVTALLNDEDTLANAELGDQREAERFRRWSVARRRLEEARLMGYDVELVPPSFVPLDIDLAVDLEDWAVADTTRRRIEHALRGQGGLFDPDTLGLGGDVTPDAVQRRVLAVEGVRAARLLRLRRLDPDAEDFARRPQMPIGDTEVAVLDPPYGAPKGILTIETCGGMR